MRKSTYAPKRGASPVKKGRGELPLRPGPSEDLARGTRAPLPAYGAGGYKNKPMKPPKGG